MPVALKQQANAKPQAQAVKKKGGIRDRIVPVTEIPRRGMRILAYGDTKTGKTRMLCSFPKPLLLIGTEEGTLSVSKIPGVNFVRIAKTEEFDELISVVREDGYKTVGLDHGGGFLALCLRDVLGLDDLPLMASWGMATQEQWGAANTQFAEHMAPFLNLAITSSIHVVTLAHERVFKGKDSGRESDVIKPQAGAALTPGAAGWLNGSVDFICQTYKRRQVKIEMLDVPGGEPQEMKTPTNKYEYCLRVGPDENYITGFRQPDFDYVLPDSIILGRTGENMKVSPYLELLAITEGRPSPSMVLGKAAKGGLAIAGKPAKVG